MKAVANSHSLVSDWYQSFKPQLMLTGLKYGFKAEEIKDIINQFFLDLLEKQVSNIENPQAYIHTSFKRRLIDQNRLSKRTKNLQESLATTTFYDPCIADLMEQVQNDIELKNKIKKAYEKLPQRCQRIIYLKFYQGKSNEQICNETGLSKRTVYNNLFEGIKALRSSLAPAAKQPAEMVVLLLAVLVQNIF